MEAENNFKAAEVEARGRLCVECMGDVAAGAGLLDRCGAVLCRACAGEFYAACAGCGGLVARDEALTRPGDDAASFCFECFGRAPEGEEAPPSEEETAALVAEYVELHEEAKRLGARLDEIKELLKRAARARPRVSNAVVLRAGEGPAGVRCSYTVRTSYDAEKLSAAEHLLGPDLFSDLFERKVTFSARRDSLEAFLSSSEEESAAARELVRAAEQRSEVETVTVVAQRKKK
ncbi:MAG TPA: hypothetical protein VGX48_13625 [Pyrinomonadaceae bacterium]|jgi:hypothetical protein|nr:hypothetical protein [Pyrinomonadaceae bacterium]